MSSPGNPGSGGGSGGNISYDSSEGGWYGTSIGDLSPTDDSAYYQDDDPSDDSSIWMSYKIKNFYEYDQHRYMAGITSPTAFQGDQAAFFQLAAPTLLWISRWTCARLEKMPAIPEDDGPESGGDWVLLDSHYETMSVILMGDGQTPLYRVSGMFVYGATNPNDGNVLDMMNFAVPPYIDDGQIETGLSDIDELSDIIDDDSGGGSGGDVSPGNPGG